MKGVHVFLLGVSLVLTSKAAWSAKGVANVQSTNPESKLSGTVEFEESKQGLKITGQFQNVPAGDHGFHIHQFGDCGDVGKKAGDHYNPAGKPHGHILKEGIDKVHAGDLGNVIAGADGKASINAIVPGLTLSGGQYSVGGRAVILHEKKDDFGQPLGNAGGRIGCGTIIITGN